MSVPPLSLAAIRQPAFLYDATGRIAEANDLAEALAGRTLGGHTLAAVVDLFDPRSPDGSPLLAGDMPSARALAGEEAIDVPITIRAADGRILHVLVTDAPILNGSELVGILSIWQDVSALERLRAEAEIASEELRVTEAELREQGSELVRAVSDLDRQRRLLDRILGAMPHHVSLWDRDWRLVWANDRFAEGLGRPPTTLVGRTREELARVAPELASIVDAAMPSVIDGTLFQREVETAGPAGPGWLAVLILPIFADQVLVITEDVTERRRAEDQILYHANLVETVSDAIISSDTELRIQSWNRAAEQIYGWRADEVIGKIGAEIFQTEFPKGTDRDMLTNVLFEDGSWHGELIQRTKEGGSIIVEATSIRLTDDAGTVIGGVSVSRDITDRKQAEKEIQTLMSSLQKGKERLESLVNSIPDEIWFADAEGKIVLVNPAVLGEFGEGATVLQDVEAIAGSLEVFRPDGTPRPVEEAPLVRALRGEIVRNEEEIIRTPASGELRYRQVNASPVKDDSGTIIGSVSVVRDITERKKAEEALLQSESLLRSFFDAPGVMQGIVEVIADDDVRHIRDNAVAAAFAGLTPEAMRNQPGSELAEPRDLLRAWVAQYRLSQETASPVTFEYEDLRDDEKTWLSATVSYLGMSSRGYPQFAYIVSDITERKRAEEALRETRHYLDNLINYANAPIIVWSPDLRITRFNAAFEHLSGYAADEVLGRELVVLFPEESREESLEKIQRTITEQWQSVEIPILRPDGGIRIALWNSANIYDKDRTTLLATIAQGQDITERIAAEEALRINAENLQRSNEDLERFAYVSSHDLQEPLRAIVSFSQLLERRYKGHFDEEADEFIAFIVEGGIRMQTLIQDLLAYSRVNTTRQDLRPTDVEDVMAAVERSLDLQLREAGAVISHDPVPVVLADPLQLEQVFANLISNAIKFRRDDVPLRIQVGARRTNGFWEFQVSDNGIGIEEEYFDQIFVIFQRLHTKDAYPGTGIGLAIVKRIIDRHGGTIRVVSAPGEGSTFFFTLPGA